MAENEEVLDDVISEEDIEYTANQLGIWIVTIVTLVFTLSLIAGIFQLGKCMFVRYDTLDAIVERTIKLPSDEYKSVVIYTVDGRSYKDVVFSKKKPDKQLVIYKYVNEEKGITLKKPTSLIESLFLISLGLGYWYLIIKNNKSEKSE